MNVFKQQLEQLGAQNQYRLIPDLIHQGRYITQKNRKMLNMSSNDYLGLASDENLHRSFLQQYGGNFPSFTSSSSRLFNGQLSYLYRSGAACRLTFPTGKRVIVQQPLSRQSRYFACFDDDEKFDFGR